MVRQHCPFTLTFGRWISLGASGRPGAVNFWSSPTLQAWTKARKIRLRFELAKTLLGHLMGIMENDESGKFKEEIVPVRTKWVDPAQRVRLEHLLHGRYLVLRRGKSKR